MTKYRNNLPQLSGDIFLTDGGIETTLIFHDGFELPEFAAFDLLNKEEGVAALRRYYNSYLSVAKQYEAGFILEAPTWRTSRDWGNVLGYSAVELDLANRKAINLLDDIRQEQETSRSKMVISGCMGPRGDGYVIENLMTPDEAQAYHAAQINTFRQTQADMVTALTMTYAEEAIGLTKAALAAGIPVVISFTVETDGCLPSGQTLKEAILQVDEATGNGPVYYMINCAHPSHFKDAINSNEEWIERIGGLRANASSLSHEELDALEELDDGTPAELGHQYRELTTKLCNLNVMGGCCGTDHRHIEAIANSFVNGSTQKMIRA